MNKGKRVPICKKIDMEIQGRSELKKVETDEKVPPQQEKYIKLEQLLMNMKKSGGKAFAKVTHKQYQKGIIVLSSDDIKNMRVGQEESMDAQQNQPS